MLDALSSSALARTVAESQMLTAWLSAVHVIGFVLVMASGLATNLRLLGVVLREQPVTDLTIPAAKTLSLGVGVSAVTGVLLFLPRAAGAFANGFFRAKLLLLVAALAFFAVARRTTGARSTDGRAFRGLGALGLSLWFGLALAAGAFILLE